MSSFDDDDDDLTDIRQLPDLNQEQEDEFESLDEIAGNQDFGENEEEEEDEEESESLSELPESPPDFEFDSSDEEVPDFEPESEAETESENDDFDFNFDDNSEEDSHEKEIEDDHQPKSDFILEEELAPETINSKPEVKKTPITEIAPTKIHNTPPEEFEEVKNFAKNMSSQNFSSEGNPPFSIILREIKYIEDAQAVAEILLKYKIVLENEQDKTIEDISRGTYLIPRLSEYAAILLCHELRRFDLEILMGLTEELTPPKSYESNDRGSTSKRTILANKKHNISLRNKPHYEEILTTTLPNFNDYNIAKHIGIASESKIINPESLHTSEDLESEMLEQVSTSSQEDLKLLRLKRENINAADSKFGFDVGEIYGQNLSKSKKIGLEHIYAELITNIKTQAKSAGANAIIGINFSISPISLEQFMNEGPRYQILCTGNMVWIEKS